MVDQTLKTRLREAGNRFQVAEHERAAALTALKEALVDANGDVSDEEAAALTHVAAETVHVLKQRR